MFPHRLPRALAVGSFLAFPLLVHAQLHVSPPTVQLIAQAGNFKTSSSYGDLNSSYQLLGNPATSATPMPPS